MRYLAILLLAMMGCSTPHYVREISIPAHKLIICDYDTLQELYPSTDTRIWGLCNMQKNIVWVTPDFFDKTKPDADIYWHEVRHLFEGRFHK